MFQFDKERSSSYFLIERRKLTLSGSKISISSLSPSLVKFFQAESQDQQDNNYRMLKRQSKIKSNKQQLDKFQLKQKGRNKRTDNFKIDQNVSNEYGIIGQKQKKVLHFKQNRLNNDRIKQKRQRAKSQDIENKFKLGINSRKMNNSDFYFTFGHNQLTLNNHQSYFQKKIL